MGFWKVMDIIIMFQEDRLKVGEAVLLSKEVPYLIQAEYYFPTHYKNASDNQGKCALNGRKMIFYLFFRPKNQHFTLSTHVNCNYLKSTILITKVTCFYLHANVLKSSIISPKCQLKDAELSKDSSACQKKKQFVRKLLFSFRAQLTLLYCAYIYSTGIK